MIKKDEPMKPLLINAGFGHYDIYCPLCKEYIGFSNTVRESIIFEYCPDCGQKIDWTKENIR